MNFSKNIKKIRSVKGLNQEAFGHLFNLSRATVGAYEEGRALPKIETIIQIANYISVSVDDLLLGTLTVNQVHGFSKVEKWSHQEESITTPQVHYYQSKKELTGQKPQLKIQIPGFLSIDSFAVKGLVFDQNSKVIYFFESIPFNNIDVNKNHIAVTKESVYFGKNLKEETNQIIYPNETTIQKKEIVNFGKQIGVLSGLESSETNSKKTLTQRVENLENKLEQLLNNKNE